MSRKPAIRTKVKATEAATVQPVRPAAPPPKRVPRVTRILALAHRWDDLIRSGEVRDRAELSRLVGVSRARVSQVMRLLDLAPDIQEVVLDGQVERRSEKALRAVAKMADWGRQRQMFGARLTA